jgi:hypothetical protein
MPKPVAFLGVVSQVIGSTDLKFGQSIPEARTNVDWFGTALEEAILMLRGRPSRSPRPAWLDTRHLSPTSTPGRVPRLAGVRGRRLFVPMLVDHHHPPTGHDSGQNQPRR